MPDNRLNLLADRYLITEFLGEGGIGVVYKADDLYTNSEVAIKFLIEEPTANRHAQQMRQRYFEREIALLSEIRHPAIVGHLGSGFTKLGLPYFVMEYVDGRTLAELLAKEGAIIIGRAFRLLQSLCSGLDCIHQHGAIHRDLKPENIMIVNSAGREEIKLLDFGLAKMLEMEEQGPFRPITQAGNIVGTVDYLAPEQWQDRELDARTDIYALGLLTYVMLTGEHPFRSLSVPDAMMMHLNETPPPPSSIKTDLPILLDEVIMRSISKDKEERQNSAVEFLEQYENVLAEIYRRSNSYLNNPATETLSFEIGVDED